MTRAGVAFGGKRRVGKSARVIYMKEVEQPVGGRAVCVGEEKRKRKKTKKKSPTETGVRESRGVIDHIFLMCLFWIVSHQQRIRNIKISSWFIGIIPSVQKEAHAFS